jgi:hypothetical protein
MTKWFLTMLAFCAIAPLYAVAGPCPIRDKAPVQQNPDAPVQIKGYYATMTRNQLDVAFVNVSTKVVTAIVWEVRIGDGAAFIRDAGMFSPQVQVNHCDMNYGLHQGNFIWRDQAGVRVVRVKFADGTQWATPDAPPAEDDF